MDEFSIHAAGLTTPATRHFVILPDDTGDLPLLPRVIYCQAAGDIVIRDVHGTDIVYTLAFGDKLSFRRVRVLSPGTNGSILRLVLMQGAWFIGAGGFRRRRGPSGELEFSVSVTGQTAGNAQDQSSLTYTTSAGFVEGQRWQTSLSRGLWSDVAGVTNSDETIDLIGRRHGDGALIRVGVWSGGAEVFSSPARLAYAPPFVAQTFTDDTGLQSFNRTMFFCGADLLFEISRLTGVSIDAALGEMTFDTNVRDLQSDTVLSVTASNSGGSLAVNQTPSVQAAIDFSVTNVTGEPIITVDGGMGSTTAAMYWWSVNFSWIG